MPAVDNVPGGVFPGYAEYVDLMNDCWHQTPEVRPSFAYVIATLRRLLAEEVRQRIADRRAEEILTTMDSVTASASTSS